MIKLYTGTPGSGKSLHIAERIYYTLRCGRPVIANFPIDLKKVDKKGKKKLNFTEITNDGLTPSFLINYSREYFIGKNVKEDAILLVIDEAQILYNAREWQGLSKEIKDKNKELKAQGKEQEMGWLAFYSQHRKFGFEIVLIAQFDGMIDRQIRSLVEYEIKHRKLSNFGIAGFIMSWIFGFGKVFCAIQYWYPIQERVGCTFFIARKKYYQIYDTFKNWGDTR